MNDRPNSKGVRFQLFTLASIAYSVTQISVLLKTSISRIGLTNGMMASPGRRNSQSKQLNFQGNCRYVVSVIKEFFVLLDHVLNQLRTVYYSQHARGHISYHCCDSWHRLPSACSVRCRHSSQSTHQRRSNDRITVQIARFFTIDKNISTQNASFQHYGIHAIP